MFKSLDRNLNKLYKFSGYVAAIFLIFVAVFILIGISSRIFGFYIRGLAEYSARPLIQNPKILDEIPIKIKTATSIKNVAAIQPENL